MTIMRAIFWPTPCFKAKTFDCSNFTVEKTFSSASAVPHRGLFQREDGSENLLEEILAWKYRRTRGKEGMGERGRGKRQDRRGRWKWEDEDGRLICPVMPQDITLIASPPLPPSFFIRRKWSSGQLRLGRTNENCRHGRRRRHITGPRWMRWMVCVGANETDHKSDFDTSTHGPGAFCFELCVLTTDRQCCNSDRGVGRNVG